ncbi:class I SAM-dependent methyltransferase [Pseudoxanthomonas gei]|uniref:Class I SAM-dependent methyltransferase n=1 Tax=Pseudoxanthomonas gei TaxID=1383030 RepID=A0ABX0A9N3_9GAMM|nr:class I SAM-dependent methyltransferase [Pseudoxanthomonas gei]NDK38237.1 class I SAM-dependent methyltransferase [Pseudoxanthomonas gei]
MNNSVEIARQRAWSTYWSAGALHSCADSFERNYSGVIGEFWRSRFQSLPRECRVLDLATGNGALPLLLWELTHGQNDVRIDAVDFAQVAPSWYQPTLHPAIAFHPGVAMEQLPFADSTFDFVVSQFGLEYARWPQALHEISRVSKPGAGAAFVMHHPDSVIVRVGREELRHLALLLSTEGLLDSARLVMPWIAHARAGRIDLAQGDEAARSKQAYNRAAGHISGLIDASPAPDLLIEMRASVHSLLAGIGAGGAGPQLAQLEELRQGLCAAELRAAELVEHAVDSQRLKELMEVFQVARPDHSIACEPIAQAEGTLGWAVSLQPLNP